MKKYALISWIALNNDPYTVRDGKNIPGPTLTLLFNEKSPFRDRIDRVMLLKQSRADEKFRELKAEIRNRDRGIKVESWNIDEKIDPTDHKVLFKHMKQAVASFRQKIGPDTTMVIHVSPGTPAMHTIWVLMAATSMIDKPLRVVQSYRPGDRSDKVVGDVNLEIDSFFHAYQQTRVKGAGHVTELLWNPAHLQTNTMRALFRDLSLMAKVKVPILILGERGTGKTTLARWIRANSPFRNKKLKNWPVMACGQFLPETMRDELFGHKKGAFSGADKDKDGMLKVLDRDTLFLDEIGDLDRDLQRTLIRAMEEKTFQPLGSTDMVKSDFRLITSTNLGIHDLQQKLDADFFDRISYFVVTMPPLRQVRDEIPWIWQRVLKEAASRTGSNMPELTEHRRKRLIQGLIDSPLPGNLRDLYRTAYYLITFWNLGEDHAINRALNALSNDSLHGGRGLPINREIAYRFAMDQPLTDLVKTHGKLQTEALERELHSFLARRIQESAEETGQVVDNICDRTQRTLRNWKNTSR